MNSKYQYVIPRRSASKNSNNCLSLLCFRTKLIHTFKLFFFTELLSQITLWGCIVSSGVVVTSLEPENDAATNFALMKITGTFIFQYRNCNMCKGSCKLSVAQSVKRIDTGWTVWESNPGGGEIFRTGPTGPGAHPSSYTTGTVSFPGVKWSERGFDHPPSSSAQVKERVELYLYSPSVPS